MSNEYALNNLTKLAKTNHKERFWNWDKQKFDTRIIKNQNFCNSCGATSQNYYYVYPISKNLVLTLCSNCRKKHKHSLIICGLIKE